MGAKSFHFEPDNTADPHFRARKRNWWFVRHGVYDDTR